jgi:hypothetical protein
MLNQNKNSDNNQYQEQKEGNPGQHPNQKTPPARRIGTATMGVTLIIVGVVLLIFLFHPFDPTNLFRFSPLLLILLGVEVLYQYFYHHGENLRYDFLGTLFCCFIIFCSLCAAAAYPFLEHGTVYWQLEESLNGEVYEEIAAQIPEDIKVISLDVDCDLQYPVANRKDVNSGTLSSGDYLRISFDMGYQPNLSQFSSEVEKLISAIDYQKYPNLSARFVGESERETYALFLNDRLSMRLYAEDFARMTKVETIESEDLVIGASES